MVKKRMFTTFPVEIIVKYYTLLLFQLDYLREKNLQFLSQFYIGEINTKKYPQSISNSMGALY